MRVEISHQHAHPAAGVTVGDAGVGEAVLTGLATGTGDGVAAGVGWGDGVLTGLLTGLLTGVLTGVGELAGGGVDAAGVWVTRGAEGMGAPPD